MRILHRSRPKPARLTVIGDDLNGIVHQWRSDYLDDTLRPAMASSRGGIRRRVAAL